MHAPALQKTGRKAQPDRRIMVPAGQYDPRSGCGEPHKRIIQQAHDVHPGQRPIIDISSNQDDIHGLFPHAPHKLVYEGPLGFKHPNAVEGSAKVPVRGVQ